MESFALPHIDIYMLCSNDVRTLDYIKELDGYFTDLLPSAVDVAIESGSQVFTNCSATANRTQVRISADGIAEFDSSRVLDATTIQSLVKPANLEAYFAAVCIELDKFDAVITEAGSEPQESFEGIINQIFCEANAAEVVGRALETAAIVGIVAAVVVILCILGCICACCGFCD
jgi:copper chaperone CopZ